MIAVLLGCHDDLEHSIPAFESTSKQAKVELEWRPKSDGSRTLARTTAALADASVTPQADRSIETPTGGVPASLPNGSVPGAGELPHEGGGPWSTNGFGLVGLLFAVNLPLAASAFRWYLERRSAALTSARIQTFVASEQRP